MHGSNDLVRPLKVDVLKENYGNEVIIHIRLLHKAGIAEGWTHF